MMKMKKMSPVTMLKTAVAALHLVVTFLVLSFKKRSIWQAILLMASTGLTLRVLLTPEEKLQEKISCRKKKACAEGEEPKETENGDGADEEEADEEFFTEEESAEMEERMRHALGGDRDGETAAAPSAKREIPRDEEASEADFQ